MSKFLELLEASVVLQAVLTVLIWGAVIYLVVTGQSVPDVLSSAAFVIFGYYFGDKSAKMTIKALRG